MEARKIVPEVRIFIPREINPFQTMKFSNYLARVPLAEKYIFDFSLMRKVLPFGALVVATLIKQFAARYISMATSRNFKPAFVATGINQEISAHGYAAHIGFFKFFNCSIGKDVAEASGSKTYYPIRYISIDELHRTATDTRRHYGDVVEEASQQLACFLVRGENKNIIDLLTYSIREMMRNVVEHSKAGHIWYCGQYYAATKRVDVAILDEGLGIYETLSRNKELDVKNNRGALNLALLPGVTRVSSRRRKMLEDDAWANSGYGLYATSRLCRICGNFTLLSDTNSIHVGEKTVKVYDASYKGTAVNISISLDKVSDFKSTLASIIQEGSRLAKASSISANPTASMVSRMLSDCAGG